MKTIGLLGGMSWESTVHYYQIINEEVQNELGGLHSAKIVLYSVEFAEIEQYQSSGQWARCGEILGKAAKSLETAGADFILICTNTIHKVGPWTRSAQANCAKEFPAAGRAQPLRTEYIFQTAALTPAI